MIYAIDPGTADSGMVVMTEQGAVLTAGVKSNGEIIECICAHGKLESDDVMVIERIAPMGMAVGASVFETVWWSGRFCEAWMERGGMIARIERVKVKHALCGTHKAKDANVRRALLDIYGGDSAGKKGGPLEKVKSHAWSALACGVTYSRQIRPDWQPSQPAEKT